MARLRRASSGTTRQEASFKRVLKRNFTNLKVSLKGMDTVNSFMEYCFELIALQAGRSAARSDQKLRFVNAREIEKAIKLLKDGKLTKYGVDSELQVPPAPVSGQADHTMSEPFSTPSGALSLLSIEARVKRLEDRKLTEYGVNSELQVHAAAPVSGPADHTMSELFPIPSGALSLSCIEARVKQLEAPYTVTLVPLIPTGVASSSNNHVLGLDYESSEDPSPSESGEIILNAEDDSNGEPPALQSPTGVASTSVASDSPTHIAAPLPSEPLTPTLRRTGRRRKPKNYFGS
ncbi:unnamed protein product [Calypogeia fissa]